MNAPFESRALRGQEVVEEVWTKGFWLRMMASHSGYPIPFLLFSLLYIWVYRKHRAANNREDFYCYFLSFFIFSCLHRFSILSSVLPSSSRNLFPPIFVRFLFSFPKERSYSIWWIDDSFRDTGNRYIRCSCSDTSGCDTVTQFLSRLYNIKRFSPGLNLKLFLVYRVISWDVSHYPEIRCIIFKWNWTQIVS